MPFAEVALPLPLRREFTYRLDERMAPRVRPGVRVQVMLGGRRSVGVVVRVKEEPGIDPRRLRPVLATVDHAPVVPADIMELCRRLARRTLCSLGEALDAAIPAALKQRAFRTVPVCLLRVGEEALPGVLAELEEKKSTAKQARLLRALHELGGECRAFDLLNRVKLSRSPLDTLERKGLVEVVRREDRPLVDIMGDKGSVGAVPRLTGAQEECVRRLRDSIRSDEYAGYLLYGVTGSGKTEVYLRALQETLRRGRTAVVLVPEISLTPQTVARFRARCGEVAVLHSSLTQAQRADQWKLLLEGRRAVAIGPRSALFAPLERLGLIVVDEEHENTFKQNNTPRYHARDMALERGRICGATVILGSATPSLESWHAARRGELALLELNERPPGSRMPDCVIQDMRHERRGPGGQAYLSRRLLVLMGDRLRRGEQAILFLNRRGFAPVLTCRRCGMAVRCSECSVPMTFHRGRDRLLCHYCARDMAPPTQCPECGHPDLYYLGFGTERVEREVQRCFPDHRVSRMDSDTIGRREDLEERIAEFRAGKVQILVGTQMIAKGLDFPRVTVVGVISADTSLHLPDFRAAERTYQLVSQVSGRAGRGDTVGVVVVQTNLPDNPAITAARDHDYRRFAAAELAQREALGYPPFSRLGRIVCEGAEADRVREEAVARAEILRKRASPGVQVLGPAAAPIERIQRRWRWHILVKFPREARDEEVESLFTPALEKKSAKVRILLDIDPVAVL